jgi:hypothetical protein
MSLVENLVQGFAEAAGAPQAAAGIQQKKDDRRATAKEELQAKSKEIWDDVKRLQDRRAALDPKSPTYGKDIADIDSSLTAHQQAFTDLYHPEKNPGALAHLGGFLREHLGGQRQPQIPATPGEAKQSMAALQASAAGPGQSPVNPYVEKKRQITEAGGTPEQVARGVFGDKDEKSIKYSDYASGLRRFVTAEGGDPDNPTAAQEEAFRQQRVHDAAAGKPQNRDDKYIGIVEKEKLGQPLTPEDKAYKDAYALYVKQTKVDPGVARAAAFGANRFIPVLDPANPENVVLMRAGEAANAHVSTPQSMSFQIDKAVTRAFTSGQPATTINYFNTATDHLKLLQETADALNNGNVQLVNKWGNAYANATGLPAPAEFNTVRAAVAGELSKTFKGTGATDQEISTIGDTINSTQSPAQLKGVIGYYLSLMSGKMDALQGQFESGKQGKPNFPSAKPGDLKQKAKQLAGAGTKSFVVNGETYDLPADKVAAFKKKYPDAKEQ